MNRFVFILASAVLLTTSAAHAKPKSLEVSQDNFVSLQWSRSGGFAGINERYTIQNHEIIKPSTQFGGGYGGVGLPPSSYSPPEVAPLSENQWKELLKQLKQVQLPAVAGNYKQEALSDGFNETLTLTLSDKDNLDQSFTISNYGDKAPTSYLAFTRYLEALLQRKMNPASSPISILPAPPVR